MVKSADICDYLDWDSNFFGINIGRLNRRNLTALEAETAMNWAKENNIDCLYFLADADDPGTTRTVEDFGFRFVDIRVTLEKRLAASEVPPKTCTDLVIRTADATDVDALRQIAGQIHGGGRFHYDLNFGSEKANAFYQEWISNSLKGFADEVLIAEVDGVPAGYVTCKMCDSALGQIGLIGVSPESQGCGIGSKLMIESIRWFAAHDAQTVAVVTQGRNCSAQCMYQRAGFVTRDIKLWYHKWFSR